MPATLNNVSVSSVAYTDALTLIAAAPVARVNLIVKDAEIYYSLTQPVDGMKPNTWPFADEIYCPRMTQILSRVTSAIKIRLAAAGTAARVTATLWYPWEISE